MGRLTPVHSVWLLLPLAETLGLCFLSSVNLSEQISLTRGHFFVVLERGGTFLLAFCLSGCHGNSYFVAPLWINLCLLPHLAPPILTL